MPSPGSRLLPALLIALLLALPLWGCTPARMAVPYQLTDTTQELPVRGRPVHMFDHTFAFGPYQVVDAHRGWTKSESWGAAWRWLDYNSRAAHQDYEFRMITPGGAVWAGQCTTSANQQILKAVGGRDYGELTMELYGQNNLVCTFIPEAGGAPWRLALGQKQAEPAMTGWLLGPGAKVRVQGTNRLANTSIPLSDPTGYLFINQGVTVGAVEIINDGAVWLSPFHGLLGGPALAAASSALLMHQGIRKK